MHFEVVSSIYPGIIFFSDVWKYWTQEECQEKA